MILDAELDALATRALFVRDGWLGDATARAAHAAARALADSGALRPAGISRAGAVDPTVRGDALGWLTADTAPPGLAALLPHLAALAEALTTQAWLGITRHDVQLARYAGDGRGYARHLDAFRGGPSRRATAIYYVNPAWVPAHGGLLRAHLPGGPVDVEPVADRLVVFLAERVEHEVLPAFAERFAVTAWYHGPDPGTSRG